MDAFIQSISEMTIGELCKYAALLFGGITCYIEFSKKIKWNPLSDILNWFGERLLGPVKAQIEELKEEQGKQIQELKEEQGKQIQELKEEQGKQDKILNELRDTQDDNEIDRIRWEIIEFARSCRNKEKHTLDAFTHVIDLYGKYHRILDRRKLQNGQIDLEYHYIIEVYKKCQMENSFL